MDMQFRNHAVLPHFSRGPRPRGFLSIELGHAKETVSVLLSKVANPELQPIFAIEFL
jgi:hypothetical protein